ncbi:MAG: hypothetical protein LC135_06680 [Phycisphaerae bacterium]|nr:hypothetical protein [Phycisphaerae bacterium]MCZ2399540.1 hypothetical protein [Phycisphaerae bacterium]NUQ48719.1 hypothetical protein [Phycisphaerae bacterium]
MIEAASWIAGGCGLLIWSVTAQSTRRAWGLAAGATLILFELSEVESRTGAWWRPWLLVWKAGCTAVLAGVGVAAWGARRSP